ncbi:MAG: hypothetical protein ABIM88_08360, partial [candidate division WOR-3 bacterium]
MMSYLITTYMLLGQAFWAESFGTPGWDGAHSIIQTTDGGYAIAGMTYYPNNDEDCLLLKITPTGSLSWAKRYGTGYGEWPYSIIQQPDGGYLMVCDGVAGAGNRDLLILKLTSGGSLSGALGFGSWDSERPHDMIRASDG